MADSPMGSLVSKIPPSRSTVELDATDIRLLVELSRDGRAPQRRLAEALDMSSPAVAERMAKLKARGVIRGYRVDIDWEVVGYSTVALLSVTANIGHEQNEVAEQLRSVRGVEEILIVTGGVDMLVRIRARGFDDLRRILAEEIWTIDGIQRTETSIVLISIDTPDAAIRLVEDLPERGAPA